VIALSGSASRAPPIGYFHIDIAEMQTAQGKLYLFVATDRTSKFAFTELLTKASKMAAAEFLRNLVKAVPYRIHTVLTDNGIQFTNRTCDRYASEHIFAGLYECGIEYRLTKVKHPWTNGQVERMNQGLKKLLSNGSITTIILSYAFTLLILLLHTTSTADSKHSGGLTPYEFICKQWTDEPELFKIDPIHQMPGLNT